MQRWLTILGVVLLLLPVPAEADENVPLNIRIIVEYIEAPHELVTEVMVSEHADSGPKLHARMRALVKQKKARIMETSILTARSGRRAIIESIMEHISPCEAEPSSMGGSSISSLKPTTPNQAPPQNRPLWHRPDCPTAFETRNVGVTLEIEPVVAQNDKIIDLRFAPSLVDLLRYETSCEHHDQWGDASVRRPIYERLTVSSSLALKDGKFGFIGLLSPKNAAGGRDTTRKIMLFVRADIAPIGP